MTVIGKEAMERFRHAREPRREGAGLGLARYLGEVDRVVEEEGGILERP